MGEYRVNLEVYSGPLDLLLYLIRREEVDIYDIPIARITEQYLRYVEVLKQLDPNVVGEFLVLAATLLEIKARMLLPAPPAEQGAAEPLQIDPRAELVRQLLEYKAFKDAAADLRDAAELQALRFPRRPPAPISPDATEIDLEDAGIWDLVDAFGRLLESIGQGAAAHQVIYDDTPIELHAADILDRLRTEGPLTFRRIFEGQLDRGQIVGLFLALLELVRLRKVLVSQDRPFGEIHLRVNPNPLAEEAPAAPEVGPGAASAPPPERARAVPAEAAAGTPADRPGQYIPQPLAHQGDDDDAGRQAEGTGP